MDWELDLLSEAVQWMVWWVDGNFPERYFSTIYQFFCCPSELLLCAPVKHNNGIIAKVSVQDLFFIFHGKKCCMEYVRNANYNIPGVHSEDDGG